MNAKDCARNDARADLVPGHAAKGGPAIRAENAGHVLQIRIGQKQAARDVAHDIGQANHDVPDGQREERPAVAREREELQQSEPADQERHDQRREHECQHDLASRRGMAHEPDGAGNADGESPQRRHGSQPQRNPEAVLHLRIDETFSYQRSVKPRGGKVMNGVSETDIMTGTMSGAMIAARMARTKMRVAADIVMPPHPRSSGSSTDRRP